MHSWLARVALQQPGEQTVGGVILFTYLFTECTVENRVRYVSVLAVDSTRTRAIFSVCETDVRSCLVMTFTLFVHL